MGKSHNSLLDALSTTKQITERITQLGMSTCCLTDHNSISGAIDFIKEMASAKKKPIIGIEFSVSQYLANIKNENNRKLHHLIILANGNLGWKNLLKLTSAANNPNNFYYRPRLSLEEIRPFAQNLFAISGHMGSSLSRVIVDENGDVLPDALEQGIKHAELLQDIFGKGNFYLECQLIDQRFKKLVDVIREISLKTKIKCVATPDAHYATPDQRQDQQVLLATNLNKNLLSASDPNFGMSGFFRQDSNYHIPSFDELLSFGNTEEELAHTLEIADKCSEYTNILQDPILPPFDTPDHTPPEVYLRKLCEEGFEKKIRTKVKPEKLGEYKERLEYELGVINKMGLPSYFLIVADIMDYIRKQGWLHGPGRGCVSADTKVWTTNDGIKDICDVKIGDTVITHEGLAKKVVNTFTYDNNEDVLQIYSYHGDNSGVKLTQDHKILVSKTGLESDLQWIQSKDVKLHDWVAVPKYSEKSTSLESLDLSKFIKANDTILNYDDEYVYQYYGHLNTTPRHINNRYLPIDKDFARAVGLFTGNGALHKERRYYIIYCFNIKDHDTINFVKKYFQKHGFDVATYSVPEHHYIHIRINSKILYELFRSLFNNYNNSIDKHVPDLIYKLSPELQRSYLDGCIEADGCDNPSSFGYKTISKRLGYQLKTLANNLGIPCSIYKEINKDKRPVKVRNDSFVLAMPKAKMIKNIEETTYYKNTPNYILSKIRKINTVKDIKKVYDLEIEDSHSYLTSSFVIHNSAGGCLVSYLVSITKIDPIQYNLIFERFLNPARGKSLADVDCDVPANRRDQVIDYIKNKYGADKVANMVTFQTMKGRGALKDVLRAHNAVSAAEMNMITKFIPDEAKIADELQTMKEENEGESSIIKWALENDKKGNLKEWCYLDEEGKLAGPLAKYFEQAIRLEGTKAHQSKHASGILISNEPLSEICPMIYDPKNKQLLAGFDMKSCESAGLVKYDILGLSFLNKTMGVCDVLEYGEIR